jgi:CubicO group peptidase (beta-lactamase class C family)
MSIAAEGLRRSRKLHRMHSLAVGVMLVVLPLVSGQAQSAAQVQELDAYIQKALTDAGDAGLAIAVVRNDSIIFAKGYGVRAVGKPEPVTPHSMFAIGSNTKLFTAVTAGIAVDDGKLNLNVPVTTYLPWFRMYDPYASKEINVSDMLSHDSGLGGFDALWYGTVYSREEILRRVRYVKPVTSFRSAYAYQNVMVMAAGEATAAAMGMPWEDIVRTRIFAPLGMKESNTSVRDFKPGQDVAMPNRWLNGQLTQIPYRNADNLAPAGSINASALDMAKWLQMLLDGGKANGKQIISPASLRAIETPHIFMGGGGGGGGSDSLTHFSAYGLGVDMRDYRGVKVFSHAGSIDGMLSNTSWIPEKKLGIVVLTNTDGRGGIGGAVSGRAQDVFAGWPLRPSGGRGGGAQSPAQSRTLDSTRVLGTSPLPPDRYAGTYTDQLYGDVTITVENGTLLLKSSWDPGLAGKLSHWHYNVFKIADRPEQVAFAFNNFVRFGIDEQARVTDLTLQAGPDPTVFRKVVPAAGRGGRGARGGGGG